MSPARRFADELRRLRAEAGLTQGELGARLGYAPGSARTTISKAENAREMPGPDFAAALDRELGGAGKLPALLREVRAWELRAQADAMSDRSRVDWVDGVAESRAPLGQESPATEEAATDRRQLLQAGGLTAAEAVRALAERIATSDPTPLNRAEIAADLRRASDARASAPRAQLRAQLEPEHLSVEALLDRRLSRGVREELAAHAGMYAYYLGWLAHGTGDDSAALAYATLCSHHAAEARDPMLRGAAAELHSGLTPPAASADIAGRAWRDPDVDPYVTPFLAAKEARGAARLRQADRARDALAAMEGGIWTGPTLPGPHVFDEEAGHAWFGIVLVELGQGEAAEGHARSSLRLLAGSDMPYAAAGTYNMLARSFLRRRHPDPEQAVAATAQGLDQMTGRPGRTGIESAERTWRELAARWDSLPAVRDLGEQVREHRRTLPTPRPALT